MKVMDCRAADNKYLHRDFHISMNMLMGYIAAEYGEEALTEYLKRFSSTYHSPLKLRLKTEGLAAMEKYLHDIYEKEEWPVEIKYEDNALVIIQAGCPGMSRIREKGYEPVKQYIETYTTVYETLCEGTPYEYEMDYFEPKSGACRQIFRRRGI